MGAWWRRPEGGVAKTVLWAPSVVFRSDGATRSPVRLESLTYDDCPIGPESRTTSSTVSSNWSRRNGL